MQLLEIRHDWPEKSGFTISRPRGRNDYTFLHFKNSITLELAGVRHRLQPGACLFYAPNTPQWYTGHAAFVHNWLHLDAETADLLERFHIPVNQILYPKETDYISHLFYLLEGEFYSDHPHREEILAAYLTEFLIRFSRSLDPNNTTPTVSKDERRRLQMARRILISAPEHPWTVAEIAGEINLSPSRFHASYKAVFGISPMRDLIETRVQNAKNLLLVGELSVREIAERLGYNSPNHFIRQFKNCTGLSPLRYRKDNSHGE